MSKLITEGEARAALGRIQARQSNMGKESRALGKNWNGPLRNAIVELIGREKYFRLIYPKAGCRTKKESPAEGRKAS